MFESLSWKFAKSVLVQNCIIKQLTLQQTNGRELKINTIKSRQSIVERLGLVSLYNLQQRVNMKENKMKHNWIAEPE